MKVRALIACALTLLPVQARAQDAGSDAPKASGFVVVQYGVFLNSHGETIAVDGGVWADDATIIEAARVKRALKEETKLANERQAGDILKWVGLGAGVGVAVSLVVGGFVWASATGTKDGK